MKRPMQEEGEHPNPDGVVFTRGKVWRWLSGGLEHNYIPEKKQKSPLEIRQSISWKDRASEGT